LRMNAGSAGKTVRSRTIPERLIGVFSIRRYTNPPLPLPLPLPLVLQVYNVKYPIAELICYR